MIIEPHEDGDDQRLGERVERDEAHRHGQGGERRQIRPCRSRPCRPAAELQGHQGAKPTASGALLERLAMSYSRRKVAEAVAMIRFCAPSSTMVASTPNLGPSGVTTFALATNGPV